MEPIERNRHTALRKAVEGWGTRPGWEQVWDETCSPQLVLHFCSLPGPIRGLAAAKAFDRSLFAGFTALHQDITALIAEGDHVAYRHRLTGRNDGPFFGRPPTGREVDITGMTWLRLEAGRVVEQWYELNHEALGRQLGLP